jgi:glyoxylase-like metal-dependent hydrolase (beta-lactamase superfamily II)
MGGASFEPVEPEIEFGASGEADRGTMTYDLHEYGFPGAAIHTPSHSPGSISLLCDDGSCFPGDILFNILPGSVMPPFADNPELLASHWRLLLDRGAQTFYPGHGRPFGRERVEAALEKI